MSKHKSLNNVYLFTFVSNLLLLAMSCFVAPLAQALVVSAVHQTKKTKIKNSCNPWLNKLPQLEYMLWGGSLMLIVDHIINGEWIWQNTIAEALHEIAWVGLPMCLVVNLIYVASVVWSKHATAQQNSIRP